MSWTDAHMTAVPDPVGIAVVQDLGSGWVAIYRIGLERPSFDSVTIAPMARSPIGGVATPAPTGELSSRMLRQLRPGAAIACAAAHWNAWGGQGVFPPHEWLGESLGRERLSLFLGPEWLTVIERLEGRAMGPLYRRDARRLRLVTTAARYAAALQAGDPTPVATVAKALSLSPSKVRDRLYAARREGFLEPTAQGRARGDLTPEGRALLEEMANPIWMTSPAGE